MERPERRVLWFTLSYIVAAGIAAIVSANGEFLYYLGVMLVLVVAVFGVHRRVQLDLAALWALSAWGAAHMAGGLVPVTGVGVLYNWWLIEGVLKYDQVVHAYGFGLTTWICWQALRAAVGRSSPTPGLAVLCAAAGMGFGALNEVIEFVATLVLPDTNVGGYVNTGWDLVANFSGAASVAAILCWRGRRAAQE